MSTFVPKMTNFIVSTDGSYCLRSWSCRFVHFSSCRGTGIIVSKLLGVGIGREATAVCDPIVLVKRMYFLVVGVLSLICVFFVSLQNYLSIEFICWPSFIICNASIISSTWPI